MLSTTASSPYHPHHYYYDDDPSPLTNVHYPPQMVNHLHYEEEHETFEPFVCDFHVCSHDFLFFIFVFKPFDIIDKLD